MRITYCKVQYYCTKYPYSTVVPNVVFSVYFMRSPITRAAILRVGKRTQASIRARSLTQRSLGLCGTGHSETLVTMREARLGFPGSPTHTAPISLAIHSAKLGGHALLGRNGLGKTLIAQAISRHGDSGWVKDGHMVQRTGWSKRAVSHVSFESHEALVEEGGTVYQALCTRSHLSAAAKFLIVRFGLYGLLYRPVTAISTGEIRKVLLARALASRPSLLVLDNAFDGLDVPSRRSLTELISTTLRGFSPLLVQGVDASAAAHTQVLLITQRAEEIVDEVSVVSSVHADGSVYTKFREGGSAESLLCAALDLPTDAISEHDASPLFLSSTLSPSAEDVRTMWCTGLGGRGDEQASLVEMRALQVVRDEVTLLRGVDWTIGRGEHWLIAGGNGAGKSTLSKLLARADAASDVTGGMLRVLGTGVVTTFAEKCTSVSCASVSMPLREGVGWISTELHLRMARSGLSAWRVLEGGGETTLDTGGDGCKQVELGSAFVAAAPSARGSAAERVSKWLELPPGVLCRPFVTLSQGEQKMVLIGAALVRRPALLVLDEPCQGLDLLARRRVLGLLQRVCEVAPVSLVYITHHYEEVRATHVSRCTPSLSAPSQHHR